MAGGSEARKWRLVFGGQCSEHIEVEEIFKRAEGNLRFDLHDLGRHQGGEGKQQEMSKACLRVGCVGEGEREACVVRVVLRSRGGQAWSKAPCSTSA